MANDSELVSMGDEIHDSVLFDLFWSASLPSLPSSMSTNALDTPNNGV